MMILKQLGDLVLFCSMETHLIFFLHHPHPHLTFLMAWHPYNLDDDDDDGLANYYNNYILLYKPK